MQNFVRQWTKNLPDNVSGGLKNLPNNLKKTQAFVRFPVLNTSPEDTTSSSLAVFACRWKITIWWGEEFCIKNWIIQFWFHCKEEIWLQGGQHIVYGGLFPVTPSQLATTKVISSRFWTTTLFGRLDELTVEVEELDESTLVEVRLFI